VTVHRGNTVHAKLTPGEPFKLLDGDTIALVVARISPITVPRSN
jgi:hypothetical protein